MFKISLRVVVAIFTAVIVIGVATATLLATHLALRSTVTEFAHRQVVATALLGRRAVFAHLQPIESAVTSVSGVAASVPWLHLPNATFRTSGRVTADDCRAAGCAAVLASNQSISALVPLFDSTLPVVLPAANPGVPLLTAATEADLMAHLRLTHGEAWFHRWGEIVLVARAGMDLRADLTIRFADGTRLYGNNCSGVHFLQWSNGSSLDGVGGDTGVWTTGGIAWNLTTGEVLDTALDGTTPVGLNCSLARPADARATAYYSTLRGVATMRGGCSWREARYLLLADTPPQFILPLSCMIARPVPSGAVLGSRGVLGLVTATIALANFSDLLHSLTDVQGTRVFMIDHNMAVIAAADTPEHDLIEIVAPEDIASVNASGGRFCVSSAGGGTGNQTVTYGCHWLFTHYPSYAPLRAFTVLQSLAAILEGNFTQVIPHGSSLANVAGFAEAIRNAVVRRIEVGGEDTYACAVGVPLRYAAPNGAALAFTLASFIPASAVDGGVSRARNLAIGITSGILILAIILSTIFIRQVLAPLERVVRSMASVVVDIGVDDLRAGAADRRKRRHRRLAAAKDDGCVKGSTDETLASTPTPQLIGSVDPLQNALPESTQADRYAPRSSGPEGSSEATDTLVNVPIAVDHEATRAFPMMPPGELLLLTATDGTGTTAAGPCGAQSAAVPKAATCTHRSDVSLASTEIPGAVMDDKVDNLAAAFDTAPAFDHSGYKYPHTDMDFSPPVLSDDALFPDSPLTATFDGPEGTHARDDNTDTRSTSSTASNGADESQSHLSEITSLLKAYADLRSTMASVSRYVPRDVVQELHATRELGQVAVRPARCSILFADIAGFTKLCDAVPPGALSGAVRVYFDRMSRLVHLYGGIVDKFIGDCVMAVWGAPQRAHHIELRAALCAQAIVPAAFAEPLLSAFRAVQHTLSIRVGAASGEVLAGNMGSPDRMSYTVIGDAVNLAARLESFNKQWGTNVMISEEIAREVAPVIVTRLVMHARIADRADPVGVYDIAGLYPDAVARLSRIQRGLPPAEDLHHATKGVPAAAAPVSFLAVGDGAAGPPSASAAATATETAAGSPLASSSEDSVAGGRARPTATDAADYLRAAAPPPIARVPVAALVELTARRYPAPPSVVDFCARYSAAAFLVHRRQFAAAAAQLRTLVPTTPVGRLFDGRQSVSRLLAVAEREQHSESSSRGRSVGSPGKPPRPKRH